VTFVAARSPAGFAFRSPTKLAAAIIRNLHVSFVDVTPVSRLLKGSYCGSTMEIAVGSSARKNQLPC
jgi:hypothetical protein